MFIYLHKTCFSSKVHIFLNSQSFHFWLIFFFIYQYKCKMDRKVCFCILKNGYMVHSEIGLRDYRYPSWKSIFLYPIEIRTETMICSFINEFQIFVKKWLWQRDVESSFSSIGANLREGCQHLHSVPQHHTVKTSTNHLIRPHAPRQKTTALGGVIVYSTLRIIFRAFPVLNGCSSLTLTAFLSSFSSMSWPLQCYPLSKAEQSKGYWFMMAM